MYRKELDTKLLQTKTNFTVTPGGAEKWGRLMSFLIGAFYKNRIFCATKRNGRLYGYLFLKYVIRILKKFPLCDDYPVEVTPDSITSWIEKQLRFIREYIHPALRVTGAKTRRQQNKVSGNKLIYLWQHRKAKAIDIIISNSCFPEPQPAISNTVTVCDYYKATCQNTPRTDTPLATPPWHSSVEKIEPGYYPHTGLFTMKDVDAVLASLPNNKASGSDGVIYETLKATRPMSTQTITHISNACLINESVPNSWKGALIHRIPKKRQCSGRSLHMA